MIADSSFPRSYLEKAISSLNENKLNGMKAEADFRSYLGSIGGLDRISPGGWIFRKKGSNGFGSDTVAVFPKLIEYGVIYSPSPKHSDVPFSLHTICATLHQIGIRSYFAFPIFGGLHGTEIEWKFIQLGVPSLTQFSDVHSVFAGFNTRKQRYNYLRYRTDVSTISDPDIIVQFSHENLRIYIESIYMAETSDIDGIVWGSRYTYPIEIKEKACANDSDLGDWFGLDVGPFVKLAHYASRRGNLHSLFIVREIESSTNRTFKRWLFTDFDQLAHYASWVPRSGGTSMRGSASMVVRVPRSAFSELDAHSLATI